MKKEKTSTGGVNAGSVTASHITECLRLLGSSNPILRLHFASDPRSRSVTADGSSCPRCLANYLPADISVGKRANERCVEVSCRVCGEEGRREWLPQRKVGRDIKRWERKRKECKTVAKVDPVKPKEPEKTKKTEVIVEPKPSTSSSSAIPANKRESEAADGVAKKKRKKDANAGLNIPASIQAKKMSASTVKAAPSPAPAKLSLNKTKLQKMLEASKGNKGGDKLKLFLKK